MTYIKQKSGHIYKFHKVRAVGVTGPMVVIEAQLEEGKRFNDIMLFLRTIESSDIPEIKKILVKKND